MSDYDDDINQSAARPGMEGPANRGGLSASVTEVSSKTGENDMRDQSGNRSGPRRTVSPPTRSAFGPDSASDPAPPKTPPPAAAAPSSPGSGRGGRQRTQAIEDAADKDG
jgi:hypothetical protein